MILGLHVSIRPGFDSALRDAAALGCPAIQVFCYRRHEEPDPATLAAFRAGARAAGLRVLGHVRYVPFLGSNDEERHLHSVRLLRREIALAAALGAEGLILHAGASAPGDDAARGIARVAEGVRRALEEGESLPLILENVPGGGRRIGGPLSELEALGERLDRAGVRVGFCLDTAHAWAQGYDLSTGDAAEAFAAEADRRLGAGRIRAFHLNDTRAERGSHREDHWHWGRGALGVEGLRALLARPAYAGALGILETPRGLDAENLRIVRELAAG